MIYVFVLVRSHLQWLLCYHISLIISMYHRIDSNILSTKFINRHSSFLIRDWRFLAAQSVLLICEKSNTLMSIIIFCSSCILADSECCNAALYEPANHITLFSAALAAETQCLFCSLFPIKRELRIHILTGFILSPLLCCKLTTYNIAVSSMQVVTLWHCVIITTISTISSNISIIINFFKDNLLVNQGYNLL